MRLQGQSDMNPTHKALLLFTCYIVMLFVINYSMRALLHTHHRFDYQLKERLVCPSMHPLMSVACPSMLSMTGFPQDFGFSVLQARLAMDQV